VSPLAGSRITRANTISKRETARLWRRSLSPLAAALEEIVYRRDNSRPTVTYPDQPTPQKH
jgi:hypothetical protein